MCLCKWTVQSRVVGSLVLAPFLVVVFFPMAATHRGSPADLADSGQLILRSFNLTNWILYKSRKSKISIQDET